MLVGGEILIGGVDFNGEKGRGRCTGFALGWSLSSSVRARAVALAWEVYARILVL